MKKQITILFLFIIQLSSWSQKTIKTEIPCTDAVLFKTPGRWLMAGGLLDNGSEYIPLNKAQVKETTKRMDAVHQFILGIYPQPMGLDAAWHHTIGRSSFGEQVNYVKNSRGNPERVALQEKPVATFGYVCGFFRHYCNPHDPKEIWPGYPGETNTSILVFANSLASVANEISGGKKHMLIGGYPVHLRQPLKQEFDGYELFYCKASVFPNYCSGDLRVLVHRKGESPYIPVTRKQYLDQCSIYLTKWYNEGQKDFEQVPMRSLEEQETEKKQTLDKMKKDLEWNPTGLKAAVDYYLAGYKTEQEIRKEQIKEYIKMRDEVLKHYNDELEETTKKGLLESPAILPLDIYNPSVDMPIFVEENVGWMVVVENPEYMRKDLPKHVPQFFTVQWEWDEFWKPQSDIGKLITEKFPFEKLQAMIDK
jgi:hypothetical protein